MVLASCCGRPWLYDASDLRLVTLVFFLAPDFGMHQALGLTASALAPGCAMQQALALRLCLLDGTGGNLLLSKAPDQPLLDLALV